MNKASQLLKTAAGLREKAKQALRLAAEVRDADRTRLTRYGEELRERADELERQAAAEVPSRPPEPGSDRSDTQNGKKPKKGSRRLE